MVLRRLTCHRTPAYDEIPFQRASELTSTAHKVLSPAFSESAEAPCTGYGMASLHQPEFARKSKPFCATRTPTGAATSAGGEGGRHDEGGPAARLVGGREPFNSGRTARRRSAGPGGSRQAGAPARTQRVCEFAACSSGRPLLLRRAPPSFRFPAPLARWTSPVTRPPCKTRQESWSGLSGTHWTCPGRGMRSTMRLPPPTCTSSSAPSNG